MSRYDEYKALAVEFARTQPDDAIIYLDSEVIRNFYETTGKTPLDYEGDDGVNMLLSRDKVAYQNTIEKYIRYLLNFNDYLDKKGLLVSDYTMRGNFNVQYIMMHSNGCVPYYTPEDIDCIINTQDIEKELTEAIIKSFYEGVASSTRELFTLQTDMVDFDKNSITTDRGVFHISKRLCNAYAIISKYTVIHMYHPRSKDGIREYPIKSPIGSLIPSTSENAENFKHFVEKRFVKISDVTNKRITSKALYYNGFVNYVVQRYGIDKCIELFDKEAVNHPLLNEAAEQYHLKVRHSRLRQFFKPYVDGLKERYEM